MEKPRYLIGIDPGKKTGFAIYDRQEKKLINVSTLSIIAAMRNIMQMGTDIELRIEDARLRKWFGNAGKEKLQGVGSVKRDSSILEEFCVFYALRYTMIHPKNNLTKTKAAYFKKITGWESRTSEHSRDAAMLVFGG